MKAGIICFIILMTLSSLFQQKNCDCNSYMEIRFYLKGKLVKVEQSDKGFWETIPPGLKGHWENQRLIYDSCNTTLIK